MTDEAIWLDWAGCLDQSFVLEFIKLKCYLGFILKMFPTLYLVFKHDYTKGRP